MSDIVSFLLGALLSLIPVVICAVPMIILIERDKRRNENASIQEEDN